MSEGIHDKPIGTHLHFGESSDPIPSDWGEAEELRELSVDDDNIIYINLEKLPEVTKTGCCQFLPESNLPGLIKPFCDMINHKKDLPCLINEIKNMMEAVQYAGKTFAINDKYNSIDSFMRARHNILHNMAMSCLDLEERETDEMFSDKFKFMSSCRTPDRIEVIDKTVVIIETTATGDSKKSFITKGKMDEGFKSKYEREINELFNNGYQVDYTVLIFDMRDPTNNSYMNEIKKLSGLLGKEISDENMTKLEIVRCTFCNSSSQINKLFAPELTTLFSDFFTLDKPELDNIDFLLLPGKTKMDDYTRVTVSTQVFTKVGNVWQTLPKILDRCSLDDDQKLRPSLDLSVNRFSFVKAADGLKFNDMMSVLLNNDKQTFCKLLLQNYDGAPISLNRADVEFFEKAPKAIPVHYNNQDFRQYTHPSSVEFKAEPSIGDYTKYIRVDYYKNLHHLYETEGYEDKLVDSFCEFYSTNENEEKLSNYYSKLSKKPFSAYRLTTSTLEIAERNYNKRMQELNNMDATTGRIRYQKSPFLHPLANGQSLIYGDYRSEPVISIEVLKLMKKGDYTSQILNVIKSNNFVWGSQQQKTGEEERKLLDDLKKIQSELYSKQLDYLKKNEIGRLPKIKMLPDSLELRERLSSVNKKLSRLRGGNKTGLSQVRISTKKKSVFYQAFKEEMEHFKKKKTGLAYKGVGMIQGNTLFEDFLNLKSEMLLPVEHASPDDLYFDGYSKDTPFFEKLKSDYLDLHRPNYQFLRSTSMYSSAAFVSRVCHSLSYYSQTSMGANYVAVDNLGYQNVLIMVKGGKKIFKTKKSKLFRLLYPIHECIINWYNCPSYNNSNTIVKFEGQSYILTPWHSLDEVILNDGLTFLHRTMAYIMVSHEQNISKSFDKSFLNIMLAFHSRRKTEELLHNLRYICVNSISYYSRLDIMLPELADFNYDFFQAFLREGLSKNFLTFSKILLNYNESDKVSSTFFVDNNLRNMFDSSPIENLEDLTITIYSTFLMSKSPTNQQLEQVRNLKNMLNTKIVHENESSDIVAEQYNINGIINEGDVENYWNCLFKSDFNFDPAYCNLLGKFSADYMNDIFPKEEFNSKWLKTINKGWDEFANTKGLRSMNPQQFFNRKGYYVVYEEILKNSDILSQIVSLLKSDEDDFEKRKKLNSLNLKYRSKLGCVKMKDAIFHVVDKKQRGGSREIFVMDLETKINQQAIEKMLAMICKKVPNEAISIPSNRRLQHIHANVFERFNKRELQNYNATLDCRKWAPHSVINKFIDFIIGMSGYLPDTFITHFLCFFSKMYDKKVYTRRSIKDIMISNANTRPIAERLLFDDDSKNGSFMEMSYSWIMGIFNYMSSFMHVMNQLHAAHIIRRVTARCEEEVVYYHMSAHSDDSGGKIQAPNLLSLSKTFFIYETLLKSCNHLISDKKSNLSNRYFEFLSVLYINNTLLSLISKISGVFNFHPTDNGYCGDVNECYSKCIEMITMGSTFDRAYLSMKISSHLIFKFYFNRSPSLQDHLIPTQLLGVPDSHPLIVMICGSDSDIVRLTFENGELFDKFLFLCNSLNQTKELQTEVLTPINVKPNIRKNDELKEHSELINIDQFTDEQKWLIKNLNIDNTGLRLLKYGMSLTDPKFVASLIDETITRRISRAFHFRHSKIVSTPWGLFNYKQIKLCIALFLFNLDDFEIDESIRSQILSSQADFESVKSSFDGKFKTYELMNYEIYGLLKATKNINYQKEDVVTFKKTCKPIHINIQKTGLPTSTNFNPVELCIWIKQPSHRWLIDMGDDYKNKYDQLKEFLDRHDINIDEVETNWLYNLLSRLKQKFVKEYFMYSNMPSEIRDVSNFQDVLHFLAHNSFKDKLIQGITTPLGTTVSQPLPLIFRNVLNEETLDILTFINFVFSLCNNFSLFREVSGLKINSGRLNAKSHKLYDLVKELLSMWDLKGAASTIVVPHLKSISKFMDDELNHADWLEQTYYYCFVKSQKLIGNIWLGKGLLFINGPNFKMDLTLQNGKIVMICCNKKNYTFGSMDLSYINSVLINAGIQRLEDHFQAVDYNHWNQTGLGLGTTSLVCIDQNRCLKMAFPCFEYKRFLEHSASTPGLCKVTLNKNFSYNFERVDEIFGNKKHTINVLKIRPIETLDLLTSLYDSEENRVKIESSGEHFKQYFKMFVGEVSGAEFRVDFKQFFELMQSTRTYAMLSDLVDADKLSQKSLIMRDHIYPGQHGGLLAALLDYKELRSDFDFNPNIVISPEMMALKSSQPEAFMSNLITNIKGKFETLYSNVEKDVIRKELIKLSKIVNSEKYGKGLLNILTNWGYVGVMGSVDEMLFIKKSENYSGIRDIVDNKLMMSLNVETFKCVLDSVVKAATKHNYFNWDRSDIPHLACKNLNDLKKVLISYVHTCVLSSYDSKYQFLPYTTIEVVKIGLTLRLLLKDVDFCEELMSNFQSNIVTSLLPVSSQNFADLMIMIQTLMSNYTRNINVHHDLDFMKVTQHSNDLIRPFTYTKDLLKNTSLKFDLRAVPHHGYFSKYRFNSFNKHKLFENNGRFYDVNFIEGELSENDLPFNKFMFFDFPVRDELYEDGEVIDEDLEEAILEMYTEEPDFETYADLIPGFCKGEYCRFSRVKHKGFLRLCERIDVNVFYLPQFPAENWKLNKIRNAGNTLLIVTNHYIIDLVECSSDKIEIFHCCDDPWENFSLMDPDCLLLYLIDTKPIDCKIWERMLNVHRLDKSDLQMLENSLPTNTIINSEGTKIHARKYLSLEEKLTMLETAEPIVTLDKDEIEECSNEIDDVDYLESQGMGKEIIDFLTKYKKKENFKGDIDTFIELVFSKMKKGRTLAEIEKERLKSATEDILANLNDVNQAVQIFEVAKVFSVGPPIRNERQNKALKDNYIRAEINSFAPKILDYILAGRLAVSRNVKILFSKHLKAMRAYIRLNKSNRENKLVLLDLASLIINDAYTDDEENNNQDGLFRLMMENLTEVIVTDEEDDDIDFRQAYARKPRMGRIYYDW